MESSPDYYAQTKTASGFQPLPPSGQAPTFRPYKEYTIALEQRPSSYYNMSTTTPSGFLEFKPRDMGAQRKYDAMSPSWEGVESSNKAVEQGIYDLDKAEKNRQDLRNIPVGGKPPTPVSTQRPTFAEELKSCVVQ